MRQVRTAVKDERAPWLVPAYKEEKSDVRENNGLAEAMTTQKLVPPPGLWRSGWKTKQLAQR